MLLSIIIVNYKTADFVTDCIKSIKKQKVDCEVIIVDNNSGMYDIETLSSLKEKCENIKVIYNKENKGFSKANNQAIKIALGDYLLFLNPDTYIFELCLEQLINFYKNTKNIGALTPKLWIDREKTFMLPPADIPSMFKKIASSSLPSAYWKYWIKRALKFWNTSKPMEIDAISGAFFLTKKEIIEKIGNFDEIFPLYFEDSDLCIRIKKSGFKLFYFPDSEAVHYYNQSAKSSEETSKKFETSEKLYIYKYYHPLSIRALSFLSKCLIRKVTNNNDFTIWDYTKPITTARNGYLLFSPLPNMIPCAAHAIKDKRFLPNSTFIDKLANGSYYFATIDSYGKIYEKYWILKK